jgi:hypothetical protein
MMSLPLLPRLIDAILRASITCTGRLALNFPRLTVLVMLDLLIINRFIDHTFYALKRQGVLRCF